jgi:flagellar protein FlaJ
MNNAFENYEAQQKELASRVQTLVETYMTMQIVVLAIYIIITATSTGGTGTTPQPGDVDPLIVVIVTPPAVSVLFLFLAHQLNSPKVKELDWKKIIVFGLPGVIGGSVIFYLNIIPEYGIFIFGAGLISSAIWPALKFRTKYSFSLDAESATSLIMRDVAEARKAGLGPEKCVIRATKRKDFKLFNPVANGIANKLEWGMTLEDIFKFIRKETKDFQVLVNFKVLFEIISSGGGNVNTLNTLANVSEKMRNIESEKREKLKPYVMVGFMLIAITGFTTLLVIDSLTSLGEDLAEKQYQKDELQDESKERFRLLGMTILIQSWIAGLFLGKITTGSYSGGFIYSIFLVITSIVSIALIQSGLFNVSAIYTQA